MCTGVCQSGAILAAMIAFYVVDIFVISRYDRQRRAEGSGRSWSFTVLALLVCILLVVQPMLLPWLGWSTDAWWGVLVQAIGLLLIAGALVLHAWSRLHLKQFYAERVEVQPDHQLIDTGPYAYIRHPLFTCYFMFVIGLFLVNPAIPTLILAVYVLWDFSRAARQEEELLGKELPGYAEYMTRTTRFFPRPSSRSGGR